MKRGKIMYWKFAEDLIVEEMDDMLLIFDKRTEATHMLNVTAKLIWQNCNGKSLNEIVDILMKNMIIDENISIEEIKNDVNGILSELQQKKLIYLGE